MLNKLGKINIKTIYFNFKYFKIKEAVKLPVLVSKHVLFHKLKGTITIEGPVSTGMIKIGYGKVGVFDYRKSRSILEINGDIIFKGVASIGQGSKISVAKNAKLVLGPKFSIMAESTIIATTTIVFGEDCLLSWENLIMDTDYHQITDTDGKVINEPKPIEFGNHVWVGCRCTILKGTHIPDNAIIGANSLLNKKLNGTAAIFRGVPAIKVKDNVMWHR